MNNEIKILFEDNHLIVAVKPPNVPTQEDSSKDSDFLSQIKEYIKEKYQKPGNVFLGLLHRLDRPVGGVMVFAKTSKAAGRLSEIIRTRNFTKSYIAVVHGTLSRKQGELHNFLVKDEKANTSKVVLSTHQGAKEAKLEYQVMAMKESFSLVKIKLITGRHHQIRVQFAEFGHPIVGDQRYGKNTDSGIQIALFAEFISFTHPVLNTEISFSALPADIFPWNLFRESLQRQ